MPPRKRARAENTPAEGGESPRATPKKRTLKQQSASSEKEEGETDWAFLVRCGPADGQEGGEGSIGRCGLPPGSLARAPDGFEVRSIDGVLPLPSHQSVARAMQKLASGEERAAAAALRHDSAASVRAFCRQWHMTWGLPAPASLAGGEGLSEEAAARIARAREPNAKRAALPGRLLVVSIGDGGESVPADRAALVDCEFEDGDALARACRGAKLATYELRVCADAAWVSARVMAQRVRGLEASGEATPAFLCRVLYNDAERLDVEFEQIADGSSVCGGSTDGGGADGGDAGGGDAGGGDAGTRWALLESVHSRAAAEGGAPSVLLCAPATLIGAERRQGGGSASEAPPRAETPSGWLPPPTEGSLLPPPTERSLKVDLPASLLQKAVRRSTALCSPLPLLEACRALIGASTAAAGGAGTAAAGGAAAAAGSEPPKSDTPASDPPRDGAYRLFWTIATCALNDVAPCPASADGKALGVAELIALSLVARVEPRWSPPAALVRRAVCTALRLQSSARAEQWQGQMTKVDGLEAGALLQLEGRQNAPSTTRGTRSTLRPEGAPGGQGGQGAPIRDAIRCALAVLRARQHERASWRTQQQRGLYDVLGCYLVNRFDWARRMASAPAPDEDAILAAWPALPPLASLACGASDQARARLSALDRECRLAAHDQGVCRELLLLLQASLRSPPRDEVCVSTPPPARHSPLAPPKRNLGRHLSCHLNCHLSRHMSLLLPNRHPCVVAVVTFARSASTRCSASPDTSPSSPPIAIRGSATWSCWHASPSSARPRPQTRPTRVARAAVDAQAKPSEARARPQRWHRASRCLPA